MVVGLLPIGMVTVYSPESDGSITLTVRPEARN
jgi:hypothetical protein